MLAGGTIASQGRSVRRGFSERIQCLHQRAILHWFTGSSYLFFCIARLVSFRLHRLQLCIVGAVADVESRYESVYIALPHEHGRSNRIFGVLSVFRFNVLVLKSRTFVRYFLSIRNGLDAWC